MLLNAGQAYSIRLEYFENGGQATAKLLWSSASQAKEIIPPHSCPERRAPATDGTGMKGEYFDNQNFTNLKLTRTDPGVSFDWSNGIPAAGIGIGHVHRSLDRYQ